MNFFTFIAKNLLRRPARSLLTIIGLAVAVGAVVSLVGVATGFERSFIGMYEQRGIDLVVQRAGGATNLNNGLPERFFEALAKVEGVKQVLGGLLDTISFPNEGFYGVLINGWPAGSALFDRLMVVEGVQLQAGDKRKATLGRELAAKLGKKVGDEIELYGKNCQVVGIYESDVIFENGAVLVLLDELQGLMDRPDEITGFTIQVNKPMSKEQLEDVRKRIEAVDPGVIKAKPSTEFVQGINEIQVARAVAWITSAIALFIGAIGMLNTMVMSVFERTREIGTLRAIGWRKSRIVQMVIGESLLLSLGGAIAGSLGGIALAKFLSKLPNAAGVIGGDVPPMIIAQGFAVAVLVGLVGAIYPALWSANLLPTEALRRK